MKSPKLKARKMYLDYTSNSSNLEAKSLTSQNGRMFNGLMKCRISLKYLGEIYDKLNNAIADEEKIHNKLKLQLEEKEYKIIELDRELNHYKKIVSG